jgi:hypothetical protein
MVNKVAVGQVFLQVLRFSPVNIISPGRLTTGLLLPEVQRQSRPIDMNNMYISGCNQTRFQLGIRTRDPSYQTAADLPRGHWDRLRRLYRTYNLLT